MAKRHDSILSTIGRTPVVRINKLGPSGVHLFAKLESFNPMGSIKDRLALGVIEDAERRGELQPGQTVVEATSGNTGIGLAMVCAQRGYPLVVTMAENFSIERRRLLRFLGARVVLTPAALKGSGMVAKAEELARRHGWWQPRQFENPANAEVHARTTALEILEDFEDVDLDLWVTGFGTGGTLAGVSRVLRERSPRTRIVVCEPDNSGILGSGVVQPRDAEGAPSTSHPAFRPHPMQGWSPDFVPKLAEEVARGGRIDRFMPVSGQDALRCARELATKEGIFVGISAGATMAGALAMARESAPGTHILCMLPDTGERYLSTPLFDDIGVDMDDEELALSRSTPGCRFDVAAAPAPAPAVEAVEAVATAATVVSPSPAAAPVPGGCPPAHADAEAEAEVDALLSDPAQPLVVFGLAWCEFCWSVRKAFAQRRIEHIVVDLDTAAYQRGDRGGRMREVLRRRTGRQTLPQIFVGGEFVGGCTDVFDGLRSGELQPLLERHGVTHDATVHADPYALLPRWLHPR
ncbi:MAG: pyridoxal-phosphate dependent enzyme [Rubrivivax sp.]|nr:pyridoxal-phosphate dependent enzyme [Rubrivivax sp.]